MTHHHARRSAARCKRQTRSRDHPITRVPRRGRRSTRRDVALGYCLPWRQSGPGRVSEVLTRRAGLCVRARHAVAAPARDNARARALGGLLGSPPPSLAENTASAVTRPQRMNVHRSGPRISGASPRRAACAERAAIDIERTSVVIADSARARRVRPKCVQTVRSCTRTNRQTIFVGASIPAQRVDRQTKEAPSG